jgi:hypothetical protein
VNRPIPELEQDPLLEQLRDLLIDNVAFDWNSKTHAEVGDAVLNRVDHLFGRYLTYTLNQRTTHVLWLGHPWLLNNFAHSPRLTFISPEPDSGKTTAMELTELLVPESVSSGNATSASIYGLVDQQFNINGVRPVVLMDELDTVFSPTRGDPQMRNIIDNGFQRGKYVIRGGKDKPVKYEVFGPMVLGGAMGVDDLHKTVISRCLVIQMQRRMPDEVIEEWDWFASRSEVLELRTLLGFWSEFVNEAAFGYRPPMPQELHNRNGLMWRPLLTVADLAGETWAARGRAAAVESVRAIQARTQPSPQVKLLSDIRDVFSAKPNLQQVSVDRLTALVKALPGSAWSKLTPQVLVRTMSRFEMYPTDVTVTVGVENDANGNATSVKRVRKGYKRIDFEDNWRRYLPQEGETR